MQNTKLRLHFQNFDRKSHIYSEPADCNSYMIVLYTVKLCINFRWVHWTKQHSPFVFIYIYVDIFWIHSIMKKESDRINYHYCAILCLLKYFIKNIILYLLWILNNIYWSQKYNNKKIRINGEIRNIWLFFLSKSKKKQ